MTGFLASLAARSTGRERVLEPRRLLFEPREEPPLDAGAESGTVRAPTAAERVPSPPPPRVPFEQATAEPEPPASLAQPPEREPHRRERAATAPAASPSARREAAAVIRTRPENLQVPDASPKPPPPTAEPTPTRRHARAAPVPASHPVWAELAERVPAPRRRLLRSKPAAAAGSPAGPDTVRITIGRVDVRAVSAAEEKTPAPRAAVPPRMTLDEYLARGRPR